MGCVLLPFNKINIVMTLLRRYYLLIVANAGEFNFNAYQINI